MAPMAAGGIAPPGLLPTRLQQSAQPLLAPRVIGDAQVARHLHSPNRQLRFQATHPENEKVMPTALLHRDAGNRRYV